MLKVIRTSGMGWICAWNPPSTVTELQLHFGAGVELPIYWEEFAQAMRELPLLEVLGLCGPILRTPHGPVSAADLLLLPSLRSLHAVFDDDPDNEQEPESYWIMSALDTPLLENLFIELIEECEGFWKYVKEMTQRQQRFPSVRKIHLREGEDGFDPFFFDLYPCVETLILLRSSVFVDSFKEATNSAFSTSNEIPFQHLKELCLVHFDIRQVLSLILVRDKAGYPLQTLYLPPEGDAVFFSDQEADFENLSAFVRVSDASPMLAAATRLAQPHFAWGPDEPGELEKDVP